jgi:L-serine dehydratase
MFVSAFEIFKVSVGPSSSHTMGPMLAAAAFLERLDAAVDAGLVVDIEVVCTLYGSLAYTGVGHGTHQAVLAGLLGAEPETYDPLDVASRLDAARETGTLRLARGRKVLFDPDSCVREDRKTKLPQHPNGMRFQACRRDGTVVLEETYFSVGGGFILTADEMDARDTLVPTLAAVPYPFKTAEEMLEMGERSSLTIAEMKRANEVRGRDAADVSNRLSRIWATMDACIERGLKAEGELPGGLMVRRRARGLAERLRAQAGGNDAPLHLAVDWLSAYAMAVNEENAAGGQVVTAPTNGAAGVIPAVIKYYVEHVPGADQRFVPDMLLTAAAIGALIKYNASISGAEVGCQGEVGSASAMAAAALCSALGGTNAQIENAAEIALEHHLGMTCDPVKGLVQVPCIERNGMGAVKAVAAASLAMAGDGKHFVPLDACIETMRQTGRDMDERYKETSLGGLSVSVPEC